MTEPDTVVQVPERAISVRLDERAQRALEELVASGLSQSDAIRRALVETAGRLRDEALAEEARRVASDPDDRAEAAAVLAFMESLSPAWPPE
jgi:Arc/MetJ-type ribon-helix-helix transcriptional regulator